MGSLGEVFAAKALGRILRLITSRRVTASGTACRWIGQCGKKGIALRFRREIATGRPRIHFRIVDTVGNWAYIG
jgi:hypothetical protein